MNQDFKVVVADYSYVGWADEICKEMEESAKARGTGIAKRSPEYLMLKMEEGKAVIAFAKDGNWAGFCYIECWGHGEYVANSGLIVAPVYRKGGLAKQIKHKIFELSRKMYPEAKVFGLTTGLAVMKINSELGYEPVKPLLAKIAAVKDYKELVKLGADGYSTGDGFLFGFYVAPDDRIASKNAAHFDQTGLGMTVECFINL